jgi:hypothetical protein
MFEIVASAIGLQEQTRKEGIEPPNIAFKARSLCLFAYFRLTAEVGLEPT